jgi:hypothetical protein
VHLVLELLVKEIAAAGATVLIIVEAVVAPAALVQTQIAYLTADQVY